MKKPNLTWSDTATILTVVTLMAVLGFGFLLVEAVLRTNTGDWSFLVLWFLGCLLLCFSLVHLHHSYIEYRKLCNRYAEKIQKLK